MVRLMYSRRAAALLPIAAVMALLLCSLFSLVLCHRHEESWEMGRRENKEREREEEEWPFGGDERKFILEEANQVVRTPAGEVRVVSGVRWKGDPNPMHIGFIHMEPNTLFIPQYIDSSIVLFLRRGEAKVGFIYKDEMVVKQLKMGDINRIPAGSVFYIVNVGKGQRLQMICSIDDSESIDWNPYQSFFIGGGMKPRSVLAGFDIETMTAAFNVTADELGKIMVGRTDGPIVFMTREPADEPKRTQLLPERLWRSTYFYNEDEEEQVQMGSSWSWRNLLNSFLGKQNKKESAKTTVHAPDSYNIFDREPDFRNTYGFTVAVDKHSYAPLKHSDITVYLVNLTAGSMLAPHINPRATEYGVVLSGMGTIQVVFPNGTMAMNAEVAEGDVFWVPKYFPFCQIASRNGPFIFFGFTSSAKRNYPQFLVGASSILQSMLGPELAVSFGISEGELRSLVTAQNYSVVLPTWPLPERKKRRGEEGVAAQ